MQTQLRRGIAALATSALSLGVLAVAAPAQAWSPDPAYDLTGARAASTWLVGNLDDGVVQTAWEYEGQSGSGPSYGDTVDLAQALIATGDDRARAVEAAVATHLDSYVGSGGETYSGSAAKALALFTTPDLLGTQVDPRDVNGQDLVARVEGTVQQSAPVAGRLKDQSAYGDYANTIGQSFAVAGLSRVGSAQAGPALDYLLQQQCDAGFFRLYLPAPDVADQTCDGSVPAEDPKQSADTTALAVIQLAGVERTPEVAAALAKAGTWLKSQQQADGSFRDDSNGNGANANTTGLGGWALAVVGERPAAQKAAVWLRSLQVVNACAPGRLAGEGGALAYNRAAYDEGARWGISDPLDRTQWVIADIQALPALGVAPRATSADAVVLPKFAKAGKNVTASVRGIAAGERACTTGAVTRDLLGTGKNLTVTLAKAKAGTRTVMLKTATGTVSGSVKVLGKKKLTVKVAKNAKRGTKKTVTVKGLAAGEKVTVRVKGKKIKAGTATKKGTFTVKVKVGKKRGTVKVSATGQYSTRTGSAKVKVK